MKKMEVYVVTHKKLDFALPSYCQKIQINCARNGQRWEGYLHDDEGDHISEKNPFYCELTALYHLWKNSAADVKGLYHYRRYLGNTDSFGGRWYYPRSCASDELCRYVLREDKIRALLAQHDVILAVPQNPFPATVMEALGKFVSRENIDIMIRVIEEYYPAYRPALWDTVNDTQISYCNMMIAPAAIVDDYCQWLFDVLEKTEARVVKDEEGNPPKRMFGYLSEVLLNVYLRHRQCSCAYQDLLYLLETSGKKRLIRKCKDAFNTAAGGLGLYPPLTKKELKGLYSARSRRMRGERLPLTSGSGEPLAQIAAYYVRLGAAVETKALDGVSYVKAVMRYPVADECFISLYVQTLPADEGALLETTEKIRAAETSGDYSLMLRVVTGQAVDEAANRRLLLRGVKLLQG